MVADCDVGVAVVVLPGKGGDDFMAATLFDDVCDRVEILEAIHELLCLESLPTNDVVRRLKDKKRRR